MNNLTGVLGWIAAALLTFLAVSLAFLVIANLGSSNEDVRIAPESTVSNAGSRFEISLDANELETLSAAPDQPLTVTLTNDGDRPLEDINVIAVVSSEDTSLPPEPPLPPQTLPELLAGESAEVSSK